jgi:hypothetical protein
VAVAVLQRAPRDNHAAKHQTPTQACEGFAGLGLFAVGQECTTLERVGLVATVFVVGEARCIPVQRDGSRADAWHAYHRRGADRFFSPV